MSWHYLQGLEVASWEGDSLDGAPSALLNLLPTPERCCSLGSETDSSILSRSGTTSELSTGVRGEGASMSSAEVSPANHSAALLEGATTPPISGPRCCESYARSSLSASSRRTSSEILSSVPPPICIESGTKSATLKSARPTWALLISGPGGGWLPTPTATANADCESMQKWRGHRDYRVWTGGRTTPAHWEFLMGWPLGWTDLQPLEMGRCLEWLRLHGGS